MRARLRRFAQLPAAQSIFGLYAARVSNFVLPLITIPYLARVLGPESWGLVVFIQGICAYLALTIEYGFEFSGTREVSRLRSERRLLAALFARVTAARLILASLAFVGLGVLQLVAPPVRETGWLLWLGAFWFAASASNPLWFFLGIERINVVVAFDLVVKVIGVAAVVILVQSSDDAWMVLAFQGAAAAASAVFGFLLAITLFGFERPSASGTLQVLRNGWNLFVFKASSSVFSMSNILILGLLAPVQLVAFYAGAERIIRVLILLMQTPVTALYPTATRLGSDRPSEIARVARASTAVLVPVAGLACLSIFFLAPLLVRLALGPGYEESVGVLRILAILLPLRGIQFPLTIHWMIPLGLERQLSRITLSAGPIHIASAVLLGSQFNHIGIAWAWVMTESFVLVIVVAILLRRGLNPFSSARVAA